MYLMYVDESGDTGLVGSPTTHFALSGMVVHESQWRALAKQLVTFRKRMRATYGLPLRTEIHASEFIKRPPVADMARHVRLAILRNFLDELASVPSISITNVIINKVGKPAGYNVFDSAWQTLFQRFENTLKAGNFPGAYRNSFGMVLTDATNGKALQTMVRRMSVHNYIPSMFGWGTRNVPVLRIIEDPHQKNSADSYFIQAVDTAAYFLFQRYSSNAFIRRASAQRYFDRLAPVLNKKASVSNPLGIVVL
jgi:hypothetical protein